MTGDELSSLSFDSRVSARSKELRTSLNLAVLVWVPSKMRRTVRMVVAM